MVIFFDCIESDYVIYMGVDKNENEELLRSCWPEDVWFHVDRHSSAHVYLRRKPREDGTPDPNWSIESVPPDVLTDCCQLVKANSIEGNKLNHVAVVYTPCPNLKKTGDMAVGQVGFHSSRQVRRTHVERRVNEVVNRMNKTRRDVDVAEFRAQLEARNRAVGAEMRRMKAETDAEAAAAEAERKRVACDREYRDVMSTDRMVSNAEMEVSAQEYEDDFL